MKLLEPGRHRAEPPASSRAARSLAAGAAFVLVAALLGWVTAGAMGLTHRSAAAPGPLPVALASEPALADPSAPTWGRAVDISAAPGRQAERSSPAAGPAAPSPARAAAPATSSAPAAPRPTLEPPREPERDAVPRVRPGDACPAEGDIAVTRSGAATVCTMSPGNGQTRWRRA
jgi:hypothetical protein